MSSFCLHVFLIGHITTFDGYDNSTKNEMENSTFPTYMSAIFLQTAAAHGIAGTFAFAAILLTSLHVSILQCIIVSLGTDFSLITVLFSLLSGVKIYQLVIQLIGE